MRGRSRVPLLRLYLFGLVAMRPGVVALQQRLGGDEALQRAEAAAAALQTYYSRFKLNNMWGVGWWHDANNVEALAGLMQVGGANHSAQYDDVLHSVYVRQGAIAIEGSGSTDDVGWWGLAWARAFEKTGLPEYLEQAALCFAHMTKSWDDDACAGGLWWSRKKSYKNAITNELFLALAVRLHTLNATLPPPLSPSPSRSPSPSQPTTTTFLQWAQKEWRWFESSGMINAAHMVNDGLNHNNSTQSCNNNGGQTYTYNQGVILGGLAWLYEAQLSTPGGSRNDTLLRVASNVADATIAGKRWPDGVLMEECDVDASCNDDSKSFKGIFVRYLRILADSLLRAGSIAAGGDPVWLAKAASYRAWLTVNAESLWDRDRTSEPLTFGPSWEATVAGKLKHLSVPTRSALDLLLTQVDSL